MNSSADLLQTGRLVLRRFTAADADDLFALDSDPAVMRFINGGRPTAREEIDNEILPVFMGFHKSHGGYGFWAAIDASSGRFVGWFHLRPRQRDNPDEPELGYRLRRSAWGRGLATEGSRALIDAAFRDLGARRVHAETMAINTASRRVMEKAGLKYVRLFHQPWPERIEGDEHGDVEYELQRADWSRQHSAADRRF